MLLLSVRYSQVGENLVVSNSNSSMYGNPANRPDKLLVRVAMLSQVGSNIVPPVATALYIGVAVDRGSGIVSVLL